MAGTRTHETDSGWVGADPDDDLDARLAAEDEAFDLSRPHIMTALGPIDPAALGVTHFGERLLEFRDETAASATFDRFDAALAEIEDLYAVGVRGVVALDRVDTENLTDLRRLASHSPLHVVLVGEGQFLDALPPVGAVRARSLDEAATVAQLGWPVSMPLLIEAAAVPSPNAARTAILRASGNLHSLTVLDAAGLDEATREALLGAGASLAFNAYGTARHAESPADLVASLARDGQADRVVLGSGIAEPARLRAHGGAPGWAGLTERFVLELMERGVAATDIRAMLVDNPQRQLTMPGRAPASGSAERA